MTRFYQWLFHWAEAYRLRAVCRRYGWQLESYVADGWETECRITIPDRDEFLQVLEQFQKNAEISVAVDPQ